MLKKLTKDVLKIITEKEKTGNFSEVYIDVKILDPKNIVCKIEYTANEPNTKKLISKILSNIRRKTTCFSW